MELGKLAIKIMREAGLVATLTSGLVAATPDKTNDISLPNNRIPTDDYISMCLLPEAHNPEKNYTGEEIDRIIHEVYTCTPDKPLYLTERFFRELVRVESGDNPRAVGYKLRKDEERDRFVYVKDGHGRYVPVARGLAQITENAWKEAEKRIGYLAPYNEHAFDPRTNAEIGMNYLLLNEEFFKKNHPEWNKISHREQRRIASAAYNGGASKLATRNWNINRMYAETRNYVEKLDELDE